MPLLQLLNPKLRDLGNDESLLALDALQDIYTLSVHNIKFSLERQEDKFLTYPVSDFNVRDSVN